MFIGNFFIKIKIIKKQDMTLNMTLHNDQQIIS